MSKRKSPCTPMECRGIYVNLARTQSVAQIYLSEDKDYFTTFLPLMR